MPKEASASSSKVVAGSSSRMRPYASGPVVKRSARICRMTAEYLGVTPGPQTGTLVVDGKRVHENRWMIVARTIQMRCGFRCPFKLAFDPYENKCYAMMGKEEDADWLHKKIYACHKGHGDHIHFHLVGNCDLFDEDYDIGEHQAIELVG